jgi:hypothetical protein
LKRSTELPQPLADAVRTRLSLSGPLTQIEVRERPHTVLRLVESERGRMWIKSYRRIGDDARVVDLDPAIRDRDKHSSDHARDRVLLVLGQSTKPNFVPSGLLAKAAPISLIART